MSRDWMSWVGAMLLSGLLVTPLAVGCSASSGTSETSDVVEPDPNVDESEPEPLQGC